MDPAFPQIEGHIIFRQTVAAFDYATVHIYLEDISYADTNSLELAHVIIPGVCHSKEETIIAFQLKLTSKVNSTADYGVRAWVNKNNDGIQDRKDLFSDTRLPVLTHGYGNQVEIIFH